VNQLDAPAVSLSIEVPDVGSVSGLLVKPAITTSLLVFGHGAGAGMNHPFMEQMSAALAARGMATLRYQFPYMEAGRRAPDRAPRLIQTVRAAVDAASRLADGLPLFAGGKSMGGRMTSMAAAEQTLPGVRGLIFFGFPLHAELRPACTLHVADGADHGFHVLKRSGRTDQEAIDELADTATGWANAGRWPESPGSTPRVRP